MKLEFERTLDDHLAYSQLMLKRSRRIRKRRIVLAGLGGTGLFFVAWLLLHWNFLLALGIGILSAFLFWMDQANRNQQDVRKACKADKNTLGQSEIELMYDGMASRRGDYEFKTRWGAIKDIVTDNAHTYIYFAEDAAYSIPHSRITSGNYILFMQELARRIEAHTLAPLSADNTMQIPVLPLTVQSAQPDQNADTITTHRA